MRELSRGYRQNGIFARGAAGNLTNYPCFIEKLVGLNSKGVTTPSVELLPDKNSATVVPLAEKWLDYFEFY